MRINIYSFLLQDIVFSIDLSNYMLYNQICLGNSINTAFPADFFNVKEIACIAESSIYRDMMVFL